jgi:hypothetical protein
MEPSEGPSAALPSGLRTLGLTLLLALALQVTGSLAFWLIHPSLPYLLAAAAILWAVADAREIRRGLFWAASSWPTPDLAAELQCIKPIIVLSECLLVWPLGFAWYLVMRRKLLTGYPSSTK